MYRRYMPGYLSAILVIAAIVNIVYLVWFVTSINAMRDSLKVIAKHLDPAGFNAINTLPAQPDPETCSAILELMGPKGEMTVSQIISATGLLGSEVDAALDQLAKAGQVKQVDDIGSTWKRTQ